MFSPFIARGWGSGRESSCAAHAVWLGSCLLVAACAAGAPSTTPKPDLVRSHVYPLPLENVLPQAMTAMQTKGWAVKRAGNVLVTNWQGGETGTLVSYRVFGQRIDAGLCAIRVERLVATTSTSFSTDHPYTETERDPMLPTGADNHSVNPNFVADTANDAAAGTAPPAGAFSPSDTSRPSPWVITGHQRDAVLEQELQREIDPTPLVASVPKEIQSSPVARNDFLDAGPDAIPQPDRGNSLVGMGPASSKGRPMDLAGIWDGTFTFRGAVTGSFSGEVTVAVDGDSIDVDDFCPANGGTLSARVSSNSVAWQGKLACPAIPVKGCPSAVLTYNSAHVSVNETTLTLVAAGTVDAPAGCDYSSGGGALSVAFIAQKADYVHISVTRVKRSTSCFWPSDWEDLASAGSMSMPDSTLDDAAYLGIIRAKGSRLSEIQRLLRHCHQVVRLHGEAVLMRLAVTRPHHD
jgi:hypothetical protein